MGIRELAARFLLLPLLGGITKAFLVRDRRSAYRFLERRWPQLEARLPDDLEYHRAKWFNGLVPDTDGLEFWHLLYPYFYGEAPPLEPRPDPFIACGSYPRGNAESLLLFRREGGHRLWFRHTFFILVGNQDRVALERALMAALDEALQHWDRGDELVMFCDEHDWLEPAAQSWMQLRTGAAVRGKRGRAFKLVT